MFTHVWRLTGLTRSEPGHLEYRGGRLIYKPADDSMPGFDVPFTQVSDIKFPRLYLGGGFKFRINGEEYRFSFVEPHNDSADIAVGRSTGKEWKKFLLG